MALSRSSVAGGLSRREPRRRGDRGNDPRAARGSRSSRRVSRRASTPTSSSSITSRNCSVAGVSIISSEGDVVFPLSMDELEIYGDGPPKAPTSTCRITVIEIERHRLRVEAEIIRPDGSVWMRIRDWEDWRFHWPGRYRDVMRQPRDFLLGEELAARTPGHLARSRRPRPCGSSRPPTWAGRSGATCSSRSSSARSSELPCSPPSTTSGGEPINSGGESPPRKLPGGSGTRREPRRLIRPTSPSCADQHGRPELFSLASPADSACRGHLDRSLRRSRRRHGRCSIPRARVGIDVETIVDRPPRLRSVGVHTGRTAPPGPLVRLEPIRVDRAVLVRQGSRRQGDRIGLAPATRAAARSPRSTKNQASCSVKLGPAH